jgi:predicted CxxxxCH...CXXCH cytochrome family protein
MRILRPLLTGAALPALLLACGQARSVAGDPSAGCDGCHGAPPPAPHVASTQCSLCHPGTVKPDGSIDEAGGLHMDGKVEVAAGSCTACHGDPSRSGLVAAAPPRGPQGETSTATPAVGAHQAHLADGPLRPAVACGECHVVPGDLSHVDGIAAVAFGALATAGGARPVWNPSTASCSAVYCHGATLAGGSAPQPVWTRVDGSQAACGACHGVPPPTGRHGTHAGHGVACGSCHPGYASGAVNAALHVDGQVDVGNRVTSWNPATGDCVGCHGAARW